MPPALQWSVESATLCELLISQLPEFNLSRHAVSIRSCRPREVVGAKFHRRALRTAVILLLKAAVHPVQRLKNQSSLCAIAPKPQESTTVTVTLLSPLHRCDVRSSSAGIIGLVQPSVKSCVTVRLKP